MMNSTLAAWMLALAAAPSASDPADATRSFIADCDAAGRRVWNISLCAPIVVVNQTDGSSWTSAKAPGPLPKMRANTSISWEGQTWLMLLAPLPQDEAESRALAFHEAFHVHQRELGLPPNSAVAPHLETARARTLIRLEWNALAQALQSDGEIRVKHVRQALAFRAERLNADPAFSAAEREQMLHEGLAAYTGTALSGAPTRLALEALRAGPARPGLSRTFAYVNGPAWGLLLDALHPSWRQGLGTLVDLPDLLKVDLAKHPTPDLYDGKAIGAEEMAAAAAREATLDRLVAATAAARGLRLPLGQMGMDFDPNRVTPAPDGSTIYEKMTLRDRWGSVQVDGQALRIAPDFSAAFLQWPLPAPGTLALEPGWSIQDDENGKSLRPPN